MVVEQRRRTARWLGALRHRDFRLFWAARAISVAGDRISWLALPTLAILILGASPAEAGALRAVQTLGWPVIGLFAGVWVDRLPRRNIMVASDLVRAVVLASIPLAFAFGHLTLAHVIVAAGVAGAFTVFFDLAATAHIPALLPPAEWADGNAKLEGAQQAVAAGAPGLAGVLIAAVSAPFAILGDVASFTASGALLARTRLTATTRTFEQRRSLLAEAADGIRVVLADAAIRRVTICAAISNLGLMMGIAIQLVFLYRVMRVSPIAVGFCYAVGSLASFVGALYNRRVMMRLGIYRTLLLSTFIEAIGWILIPLGLLLPVIPMLLGALVVSGFFNTTWNVSVTIFRQVRIPQELLGRVSAAGRVVGYGALPLGSFLGGLLGQTLSAHLGQRFGLALALATGSILAASSAVVLLGAGPTLLTPAPAARVTAER